MVWKGKFVVYKDGYDGFFYKRYVELCELIF